MVDINVLRILLSLTKFYHGFFVPDLFLLLVLPIVTWQEAVTLGKVGPQH